MYIYICDIYGNPHLKVHLHLQPWKSTFKGTFTFPAVKIHIWLHIHIYGGPQVTGLMTVDLQSPAVQISLPFLSRHSVTLTTYNSRLQLQIFRHTDMPHLTLHSQQSTTIAKYKLHALQQHLTFHSCPDVAQLALRKIRLLNCKL